ncbi:FeoC-like transcriptional regulator [Vibrio sp. NTOU-M3]|uniref:FeoC-like transcriptional regulator n=1 Tax=Vibrio sp. NTOU-M3 TaxID=3234954 RepID=UPI00349F6A91
MILSELKQYIADHGMATRVELAKKYALSEDGVDAMLAIWIRKNVISRTEDTNAQQKVTRVRYALNRNDALSLNVTL